jgi:glycosyltransferase involved in cell wall biosynthesis
VAGAPRVSTKSIAAATGPRQHILGTISGFRANGWQVAPYIVGDKVQEAWLQRRQEGTIEKSFVKRLAADAMRIVLAARHTGLALRDTAPAEWVYERCGAFLAIGYFFQRRGIPWILETNSLLFAELVDDRKSIVLSGLVRWVEQFAYRKCDVLVVVSDALRNAIVEKLQIPAEKIIVVPNAADTETFNPDVVTPRRLFDVDTFVIGFQGGMYKWAGLRNLLHAVGAMRAGGLNVAAVLVGEGPERQGLERLAAELNIADHVRFPGLVRREQVPEYIAGYDLCYSGQINLKNNAMYLSPLKLYDYMAMGKPVIASRFADAVTLTKGGQTGYLFTPEDLKDLIAVATRAYDDRDRLGAMGANARAEILANHTWSSRIRGFITTAEEMLAKRSQ